MGVAIQSGRGNVCRCGPYPPTHTHTQVYMPNKGEILQRLRIINKSVTNFRFLDTPGEKFSIPIFHTISTKFPQNFHKLILYLQAFYSDKEDTSLEKILEKHKNVFQEDGNTGLMDQVVAASQKAKIKRLTKVFLTLSLEDVAER